VGQIKRPTFAILAALPLLTLATLLSGDSLAAAHALMNAPGRPSTRFIAVSGVAGRAAATAVAGASGAAAPSAAAPAAAAAGPDLAPTGTSVASPDAEPQATIAPQPQPTAVAVSFHRQMDPDWCDPADLQMWMQALGVALPGSNDHDIQQAIWDYELAHNDGYTLDQWNASPYAVAAAFEHFSGQVAGDPAPASADAAGAMLSRSITINHQPAIVMVGHGSHYILVTGVTLGPAGVDGPPADVTVIDPLAQGDNPIDPATGGTATYGWSQFTSELFTVVQNRPGSWEGHWIVIAADQPTIT
jgi:hypothetical protein